LTGFAVLKHFGLTSHSAVESRRNDGKSFRQLSDTRVQSPELLLVVPAQAGTHFDFASVSQMPPVAPE